MDDAKLFYFHFQYKHKQATKFFLPQAEMLRAAEEPVAYSVGQIVYTTSTGTSGSVAQGVEQAYEIYTVGVQETALNISLSIFPNPTSDYLTLKVEDYNNEALSYSLLDEQGKLVLNEQITNQDTQVAMSTLARGAYFINVLQENKKIQTFKIIKN